MKQALVAELATATPVPGVGHNGGPLLEDDYITSGEVRRFFGGISDMSLWRWTRDLGFPKPDRVINRRKYWRRSTINSWQPQRKGGAE